MSTFPASNLQAVNPLRRDPSVYHLPPDASRGQWNLLRVGREFDSPTGHLTEALIDHLNEWASCEEGFDSLRLRDEKWGLLPREILLLDGSPSRLPLATETARVLCAFLEDHGMEIPVRTINRRDALLTRVAQDLRGVLVLSQAAQRSLYDARLAEALERLGVVVVPGALTAPGGPLSNKKTTYELLEGHGPPGGREEPPRLTARYQAVEANGDGTEAIAEAILTAAAGLAQKWKSTTFFIKPQEGGGGRGCFRLDVLPGGFALPDLSRMGLPSERTHPIALPLEPENRDHLRALAWVASRFSASPATSRAYLHNNRLLSPKKGTETISLLKQLLGASQPILSDGLLRGVETFPRVRERLTRAIDNYEQLFGVSYRPLICEWIDFGLFSLRAHLRLGRAGPVLESLYARLFPIQFNENSIGITGVDSISNRIEGGMEFNRYAPLVPALVNCVGGRDSLAERLKNAFFAFQCFVSLLPPREQERLPARCEFDISPLNGLIAEGNADPVRAQCANSRWARFTSNTRAWAADALSYYSWKSRQS